VSRKLIQLLTFLILYAIKTLFRQHALSIIRLFLPIITSPFLKGVGGFWAYRLGKLEQSLQGEHTTGQLQ
jgi:hypothetical protein